jgi:hypothetical protein
VSGNDAVAGHDLILHAEIAAPMRDERVDLLECVAIEKEQHALARRQLAGVALTLEPLFPTALCGPALKVVQE